MPILLSITVSLISISACIGVGMRFRDYPNGDTLGLAWVVVICILQCATHMILYNRGKTDGKSLLRNLDFFMRKDNLYDE